jgi:PTH1 family peptidyl-tRNA hydrolase
MGRERWLVVGLGNPQADYGGTRHNIGADTVRRLAERLGATFKPHKAQAQVADTRMSAAAQRLPAGAEHADVTGGTPLSLVLPFGFYNESGGPVQRAIAFYKVPLERLVVVHDDIDLECARLRLKRGGGTAGNKGLRDIQRRCGGPDFFRVRIGIGRPPGRMDPADYVLKRFAAAERDAIDVTVERACDAVLDLVGLGLEAAQNRHHAA